MQDSTFSRSRRECLSPFTHERVTSSKTHDSSIAGEARAERNTKQPCDFHNLRPEPSKRGTDSPQKKQRHSRRLPWPSAHSHKKSKRPLHSRAKPCGQGRKGRAGSRWSPSGRDRTEAGPRVLGLPEELEHSTKGRGQAMNSQPRQEKMAGHTTSTQNPCPRMGQ